MIFGTCLIETSIVDAPLLLPAGLRDDNRVGQPPRVMDLLYEASVKQLFDFFTDEVLLLHGLLLGLLLDRFGIRLDLQMVLDHLPRDPRHLWRLPGKHVDIRPEEGVKHEFLFVAQISCDAGGLCGIRPDLDGLHGDALIVRPLHMGC
jgi:hypothetical protein